MRCICPVHGRSTKPGNFFATDYTDYHGLNPWQKDLTALGPYGFI